ncbi:MAG: DUF1320 domain-containing protein [Desulfovibrionaceae bacterium]|jgi:phage gp36-like protein|nr:DUF1320 domain-containing protein [Desulfovibrionaceae bacterium]
MYITLPELAERPGPRELAQVAGTLAQPVRDEALMDATLRGLDRSAWSAEEQAFADAALKRIIDAVAEADAVIDGFLARRGYAPLPLALPATSAGKNVLASWSRAISRYYLNKSRTTKEDNDPVVRDYRDALRMLGWLADGKYSLGGADPEAKSNTGTDVRFDAAAPVFGRNQLNAFR